ncbi:MAG: hypothetical protein KUG68_12055 [Flavobacteriaceae bacterium]|nr:hypothetical protein [Flavobacteriaceae bacterium]
MKKIILLLSSILFLVSCSSVKRNQNFISEGDYNRAIDLAVKKLQKNKTSSKFDEHIVLLEDAYKKAVQSDQKRARFLEKTNDPFNYREIYFTYSGLEERQDLIRPLLPLYSNSLKRNTKFKMVDYSSDLISAKDNFVAHLYDEGNRFMGYNTIMDYRKAYTHFCEVIDIKPNYKDSKQLLEEVHFKGTDFVFVSLQNHSGQIIPFRLEKDLLNFNTYGLDTFWTEYHSEIQSNIEYSFGIDLNFRSIDISPERIFEETFTRTKRIKDGWEYKRDRNGNIIKDENGNPIKIDVFKTVRAHITITTQTKSTLVTGEVFYSDFRTRRTLNRFPLSSEFIFEHLYAEYRGDKRALTSDDLDLISNHFEYFPSNEQMVFDAGEDIKIQLKEILEENSLR